MGFLDGCGRHADGALPIHIYDLTGGRGILPVRTLAGLEDEINAILESKGIPLVNVESYQDISDEISDTPVTSGDVKNGDLSKYIHHRAINLFITTDVQENWLGKSLAAVAGAIGAPALEDPAGMAFSLPFYGAKAILLEEGQVSLTAVMHELGHVLGLNHCDGEGKKESEFDREKFCDTDDSEATSNVMSYCPNHIATDIVDWQVETMTKGAQALLNLGYVSQNPDADPFPPVHLTISIVEGKYRAEETGKTYGDLYGLFMNVPPGSVITFLPGTYSLINDDLYEFSPPLEVELNDLTLIGQDGVSIKCYSSKISSTLSVQKGRLSIRDIHFFDTSSHSDVVVGEQGTLELERCVFENFWAPIRMEANGSATISETSFINNEVAIKIEGEKAAIDLKRCSFTGNKTGIQTSYEYEDEVIREDQFARIVATDTAFTSNTEYALDVSHLSFTAINTVFSANNPPPTEAMENVAVSFHQYGNFVFDGCLFQNNGMAGLSLSTFPTETYGELPFQLLVSNCIFETTDDQIIENEAIELAGISTEGDITIENSLFKNWASDNTYSVVNIHETRIPIRIVESEFQDNGNRPLYVGSIDDTSHPISIENSLFEGNATGAIYLHGNYDDVPVWITGCQFMNNQGSALDVYRGGHVFVSGCTFEGNSTSNWYGSAIYSSSSNVTVEDTTFTANQNSAIYANLSSLDIGGANFSGNHAYAYEGAAMVLRGSQCLLSDDIFTNQVGDSVISLDPDNQTPAFLEVDSTIVSQGNLNFNSQSPSPDIRMPNADVNFADLSLSGEQTALCSSETSACMSDQE